VRPEEALALLVQQSQHRKPRDAAADFVHETTHIGVTVE
jgi:hypothetical protein